MRKTFALLILLALVLTACGAASVDGDDASSGGDPQISGICAQDDPDCNDTPGSPIEEEQVIGGALSPDGGLTVSEALTTDATGVLAVKGFLVADAAGVRLCESLEESLPPQCGGSSIEVGALTSLEELTASEGDVRWSDSEVVVFGEIVDGVLVADETVNG